MKNSNIVNSNIVKSNKAKSNYYKATITLAIVLFGFIISYPFHTYFWGGLFFSGCSAGLIGGLADWFAVSALFRRPLGIRPGKVFRTEIIPQNRERIFASLVEMVQNELLTKEILTKRLNTFDITHFLIDYFNQKNNQEDLKALLKNMCEEVFKKIDPQNFHEILDGLLQNGIHEMTLSKLINDILEFLSAKGYEDSLLEFAKKYLVALIRSKEFLSFLEDLIENAYLNYESEKVARKIIGSFLPSPQTLAAIFQSKLEAYLEASSEDYMLKKIKDFRFNLISSPTFEERVKQQLITFFQQQNLRTVFTELWNEALPVSIEKLSGYLPQMTIQTIVDFGKNSTHEKTVDLFINNTLLGWVDKAHFEIGRIVRNSLDTLPNNKLVEMLEARAGNDLQMIRINGSVVGGITGILLFLLNFLIQFGR